jgi:hypothetical protein
MRADQIVIHQRRTLYELAGLAVLSFVLVCALLWGLTHG